MGDGTSRAPAAARRPTPAQGRRIHGRGGSGDRRSRRRRQGEIVDYDAHGHLAVGRGSSSASGSCRGSDQRAGVPALGPRRPDGCVGCHRPRASDLGAGGLRPRAPADAGGPEPDAEERHVETPSAIPICTVRRVSLNPSVTSPAASRVALSNPSRTGLDEALDDAANAPRAPRRRRAGRSTGAVRRHGPGAARAAHRGRGHAAAGERRDVLPDARLDEARHQPHVREGHARVGVRAEQPRADDRLAGERQGRR